MSVEIVQYFNGVEVRVRRNARTNSGARRGVRACASGNGWGVKLRGTKEALESIGAFEIGYGQLGFIVDPRTNRTLDCEVL